MKEYIFWGILIFMGFIILSMYAKRKHTIKSAFMGMLSGGISLILVHSLGGYVGADVPINLFNTAISLILGVPGTILITAVNIFL